MNRIIRLSFGSFVGMLSHIFAQEIDNTQDYSLNKIVASASGFNQELRDAPASMSVLTGEELKNRPVRDLAEALSFIGGVSIDQGVGKTGGYDISIRGMGGNYTLILMDGKRQNTTTAGFPNGFTEVITSFMPPISAIERIEVIKGPASTLYGSDAIGGIVNIITKKQFDKWGGNLTLDTTLQEESAFGHLYGLGLFIAGPLDKDKKYSLSFRLREQYRQKVPDSALKIVPSAMGDNISVGRNSIVGLSQNNNSSLGLRLGYVPDSKNYFYVDIDHGLQWYDNSQNLLGTVGVRGGYDKNLFFTRNNLILAHQGKYDSIRTDTSIQYISILNAGRVITTTAVPSNSPLVGQNRDLLGGDVLLDHKSVFDVGEFSTISIGGRYFFTSLHDRVVPDPFMFQHNFSFFAENETHLTSKLAITLGLRENYNSAFGFNASPRIYAVYNALSKSAIGDLIFKGGISTGYKTPTVSQLVRGINGLTGQGTIPTYGNPNLKPESSINYEVNIFNETNFTEASLGVFFIQFQDKIQSVGVSHGTMVPVPGGGICQVDNTSLRFRQCNYSINADEAISYGLESYFALKPLDMGFGNIGINTSYTFNKTMQTSGTAKGLPLTDIPMHTLNSAITYGYRDLSLYLRGEFKAKQLRTQIVGRGNTLSTLQAFRAANPGLSEYYKPYFLLHMGGSYAITKSLKLHFGVYNLLNHSFIDYVAVSAGGSISYLNNYNYVREGRRYYLALNVDF